MEAHSVRRRGPHLLFLGNMLADGGEVVAFRADRTPFTVRKIPGTHLCQSPSLRSRSVMQTEISFRHSLYRINSFKDTYIIFLKAVGILKKYRFRSLFCKHIRLCFTVPSLLLSFIFLRH
jgi:hypothetical protein